MKKIKIENFRNIKNLELDFSESETLILGKNAQGKTSILEALYFFATGKAYRAKHWSETISFEEDFSILEAEIGESNFFIGFQKSPRKQINFKINGVKKKLIEFIGNFQCVLFAPEDLSVVSGSPAGRRDFLDSLLVRLDRDFAYALGNYGKILKQRNSLLKEISEDKNKKDLLEIWDEKLIENGILILEKRLNLLEKLKTLSKDFYKKISKKENNLTLEYETNLAKVSKIDFESRLKERRERDILLGATSVGPHRDDLKIFLDGKELKEFGSQGEVRTLALSLKYSEIEILKEKGEVLLLLDDVFSELDKERQNSLIELSKNYQTVITSTHLPEGLKGEKVVEVENGEIKNPSCTQEEKI